MRIKTEGFLDTLASLFDAPNMPAGGEANWMNNHLDPHDMEDLYEGVLTRLRTVKTAKEVAENLMPAFFPADVKKTTLPKTINPKLIGKYRDKMEDAIVEFCTKDAIDIIKRLQKQYVNQGKTTEDLDGDIYLGTILQQVHSKDYDLIDKLTNLWKEFDKESQKEEWQISEDDADNYKSKSSSVKHDDIIKNIVSAAKKRNNDLTDQDILDFLSSETGIDMITSMLAKRR